MKAKNKFIFKFIQMWVCLTWRLHIILRKHTVYTQKTRCLLFNCISMHGLYFGFGGTARKVPTCGFFLFLFYDYLFILLIVSIIISHPQPKQPIMLLWRVETLVIKEGETKLLFPVLVCNENSTLAYFSFHMLWTRRKQAINFDNFSHTSF